MSQRETLYPALLTLAVGLLVRNLELHYLACNVAGLNLFQSNGDKPGLTQSHKGNMSDYRTMSEVNGRVNASRRNNRLAAPWLQAVIDSPVSNAEHKEMARKGLECIKSFDALLCKGYVSTGYQYDDFMVERDMQNDTWLDNELARNGSTPADEAEAEIAFAIASRRAGEAMKEILEYFAGEPVESLLPEFITVAGEQHANEHFVPLREWISEGQDALQESYDDRHDYQD